MLDGHNGSSAAVYAKENLLSDVMSALPSTLTREEWLGSLPRALVAGFVKTDKDFQEKGLQRLLLICSFFKDCSKFSRSSFYSKLMKKFCDDISKGKLLGQL